MKNLKTIILKNKYNVTILFISLLILIIGTLAINFLTAFLIVAVINAFLWIPPFLKLKGNTSSQKKVTNSTPKVTSKTPKVKKQKNKNNKALKIFLISMLVLFIIGIATVIFFFYLIIKNAPEFNPDKLHEREASVFYDINGKVITKVGNEIREKITYDEMPEVLVDAIIATEDARFFQHNGFDLPRFLKASFGQALGKSSSGGASTLTMQLSKNKYTSKTAKGIEGIMRKFTDIYFSIFEIEKKYTKQQILEFYANYNYLGGSSYGVEQASLTYFKKNAKDMNLSEAALVAGLFNAPNALDPYINPEGAEARRKTVLYLMERHGYISTEERKVANLMTVDKIVKQNENQTNAYSGFITTVAQEIINNLKVNPYEVPMEIYTTMDMDMQKHIGDIFSGETYKWENDVVTAGVAVINNKTGAITAVGNGRNKNQLGYNFVTMMERHIGSTSKPLYDYAPGIEYNNWSTYHLFADEPHSYTSGTEINNWDNKFLGLTTLRESLKTSRNIPALKAFQSVGNSKIKNFVTSIGLSPEIESGIIHEAHSVGGYTGESPLSVAAAYSIFASGGYYIEPYSFTKIVYRDTGEVHENKPKKTRVLSKETAYMITDVLLDAAKWGLGNHYNVNGVTYAAKTGTSNFNSNAFKQYGLPSSAVNDLWIASYNPDYSIAQWYGYEKMFPESGKNGHYNRFGSTVYRSLFQQVAKGVYKTNSSFQRPSDVISVAIEKDTFPAQLPSEFTPKNMIITELFKKGTEPTEVSKRYSKLDNPTNLKVNNSSGDIIISWDPIATPKAIDESYLDSFSKQLFKNETHAKNYFNDRVSYNNNYIGDIGYSVYIKKGDQLQLLGFTKNNEFKYTDTTTGNITIVVKSSYSIFKDNASSGAETTYVIDSTTSTITSNLVTDSSIQLHIGDDYVEDKQPIIVYEDTEDVTNLATIKPTIVNSKGETVTSIKTTSVDTFKITYTVTYKNYKKQHIKTVIILDR